MVKSVKPRLVPQKNVKLAKQNIAAAKQSLTRSSQSLSNGKLSATARKLAAQRGLVMASAKISQAKSNVSATRASKSISRSASGSKSQKIKAAIKKMNMMAAKQKPAAKKVGAAKKKSVSKKKRTGAMREYTVYFNSAKQGTGYDVVIRGSAPNAAVKVATETGLRGLCMVFEAGEPTKHYDVQAAKKNPNLLHATRVN